MNLYGALIHGKVSMGDNLERKIQELYDNWWMPSSELKRGSLIEAFVPHVDQVPYQFQPIGRTNPREHTLADVLVKPLVVGEALKEVTLPVAGMPKSFKHECWSAYRAKVRPCLVLGIEGDEVSKALTRGMANHSTARTFIVAPYYGIKKKEKRSGFNPEFVERVRHISYKQFFYDELPHTYGEPSILRFDHILPVGTDKRSYKHLGYSINPEAMSIIDEFISWNIHGGVQEDSIILLFKDILKS